MSYQNQKKKVAKISILLTFIYILTTFGNSFKLGDKVITVQSNQNQQSSQFQTQKANIQNIESNDDFTGNLTQTQIAAVKRYISEAQNLYKLQQLNQIARYISDGLQTLSKIQYWGVHVFDNATRGAGYEGNQILNKYLWWIQYGKYQLTYVMLDQQQCYGTATAGALAQFGQDVSSNEQDYIKQVVKSSQLYNGEDCEQGAKYIKKKMQQKIRNFIFDVIVTRPSTKYGFYRCKRRQYWAQLRKFGTLQFNYYIVRVF